MTPFRVTSFHQLRNEFVFSAVISACEKSSRWQRAVLLFQDALMGEAWDRLCCSLEYSHVFVENESGIKEACQELCSPIATPPAASIHC